MHNIRIRGMKSYTVEASIGHVRDLPQSASDIPKDYKSESWARLGIDVENEFDDFDQEVLHRVVERECPI